MKEDGGLRLCRWCTKLFKPIGRGHVLCDECRNKGRGKLRLYPIVWRSALVMKGEEGPLLTPFSITLEFTDSETTA